MGRRFLLFVLLCAAMATAQVVPDCDIKFSLTSVGARSSSTGCGQNLIGIVDWRLVYNSNGFSAVSVSIQDAADSSGSPGSWNDWQGSVIEGVNPATSTTFYTVHATGFYPWVSATIKTATGSGTVSGHLYGCRSPGCGQKLAFRGPGITADSGSTTTAISTAAGSSVTGYTQLEYNCLVVGWTLNTRHGDTGSATVDVWVNTGSTNPTISNSITASAQPSTTGESTLGVCPTNCSGWTTFISAGANVGFNIQSISGTVTLLDFHLKCFSLG